MRFITMALVLGIAACTAPSQGLLDQAMLACSQGNRLACSQLPALNAQVQAENQQNQIATGAAVGIGALLGGALIGSASSGPHYHRGPGPGFRPGPGPGFGPPR